MRRFVGTVGLIWFLLWMVIVADSPDDDKRISFEELQYITETLNSEQSKEEQNIPWLAIFQSLPVWAITVSHFSENWGCYTLITQLPKFMKSK